MKAAIITVSTSKAAGEGVDESGPALAEFARSVGCEIHATEVLPDSTDAIEPALRHYADGEHCDLILTTGGTGFSPDDCTPEATRAVIVGEAPGVAEAMRAASREHTQYWLLSRGVAGIRGRTLIINFPGSPKSIAESGEAIAGALPHALALLAGEVGGHHG